jgi:hypothetical protein
VSENRGHRFGGSMALASGGWQAGTTPSQPSNSAVIPFAINGRAGSRSMTAAGYPWVQAHSFQAHVGGTVRLYGVLLDAAAGVSMSQGPAVLLNDLANGVAALQIPPVPADRVLAGLIRVAMAPGIVGFLKGLDSLTSAGARTVTFLNASMAGAEPLRA